MKTSPAKIIREYGPFPGVEQVHGVTYDGKQVWFAAGGGLALGLLVEDHAHATSPVTQALPSTANIYHSRRIASEDRHEAGRVLSTIPAPGGGADSGMAWAEGTLWVASIATQDPPRSTRPRAILPP